MKKKTLLLQLSLVGVIAGALTACGDKPVTSSETSSEAAPVIYNAAELDGGSGIGSYADVKGVDKGTSGVSSLTGESIANKTKILGALEKYAVDNTLTGLPLYENGAYVMYNERVVKPASKYVTGYGFGIMREGKLASDLTTANIAEPSYYHNWEANDPATINALNSDNSQVADLFGNISGSYFGTKLNDAKNGYDWYGSLSKKDQTYIVETAADGTKTARAATADETGKTWRVYLRTNEEGVTYRTGSTVEAIKAYDGKKVVLADYVNAFKILLCGKFGYYRGNELAGQTGKSGIVGAQAYYSASSGGMDTEAAKSAWDNVGIVSGTDATEGDYIDFTFLAPTTRFYSMYTLSEGLYEPINLDFFNLVTNNGADSGNYGSYNSDKTRTPVDSVLSVGPYYLSEWEDTNHMTFVRNDNWYERKANSALYQIKGIYTKVLTAYNDDENAAIKEFLLGNLDAASIPTDYLKTFKNDPRTVSVPGDATFKLNINSCSQDLWEKLFGEKGTIAQTSKDSYWSVKPWMANSDFVKGLNYAVDRSTYATNRGVIPSINYFSTNYMSDPEGGVSYDTTTEHDAAVSEYWGAKWATDYGYSLEASQNVFNSAITTLMKDGDVKNGDKLTIKIWWMYTSQVEKSGDELAKYFTEAFDNCDQAKANNLTLDVQQEGVTTWSDVYYKHLMVGQFDLAFGAISGNSLDPLNFMEVLKSDNSSGFTLNWGADTSAIDLEYGGTKWSFDNLWAATDHGVVTYKGQGLPPVYIAQKNEYSYDETDNSMTFSMSYTDAKSYMAAQKDDTDAATVGKLSDGDYKIEVADFFVTDNASFEAYADASGKISSISGGTAADAAFTVDKTAGTVTVKLSEDALGSMGDTVGAFHFGIDVKYTIKGITTSYEAYLNYNLGAI